MNKAVREELEEGEERSRKRKGELRGGKDWQPVTAWSICRLRNGRDASSKRINVRTGRRRADAASTPAIHDLYR